MAKRVTNEQLIEEGRKAGVKVTIEHSKKGTGSIMFLPGIRHLAKPSNTGKR
jgi:hypothetical protein